MAHIPFHRDRFRWGGMHDRPYKSSAGDARGMGWKGIARQPLDAPGASFESRYFELAPGGYSSLEKHRHVHLVYAVRGHGRALVGDRVVDLAPLDALYVPPHAPHRWLNEAAEPFGFLCTVDAGRDAPAPLDDAEWETLRTNPETAPYVF